MKRIFLLSITMALLISTALAPCGWAASSEWPQAAALERDQVLAAAANVTSHAYPNANTVLVDNRVYVRYEEDGSYQSWDDEYVKILTEKGRRESQQRELHFNVHYSRAHPVLIDIIKPDGETVKVDIEKQSRSMTDPSQMGSNIYNPDSKVLMITIPGLEVGDIVHTRIYRDNFKARMANTFSDYTVFEYTSPIKRIAYEIDGPRDMPLQSIALKAPVAETVDHSVAERGERILYRWVARDVPRMYEEPEMPPLHTVVQRLLVSTIPDWQTVSRWYWNLSKPRLDATTPAMRAKVEQLIEGAADEMDKVRRIFRFVSQDIRYMGITTEDEAPGYEPHDVSITFENRYGVCRDKAALLVAMLRMAELKAYPVLIHAGPRKDREVPQPYFNHAIVAAELEPGEYTLMDPTDENTRDLLPRYLCDKSYLVAKPKGETLKTSPIIPASENILRIASSGSVDAEGKLEIDSKITFEGVNDTVYRGFFARQKPEDLRRFFERTIRRGVPGARLESLEIYPQNLRDTATALEARLSFGSADCLTGKFEPILFQAPWLGRVLGMANIILRGTGLQERKYPLRTDIACGVDETFSIDTSGSALVAVQPDSSAAFDSEKSAFSTSIEFEDDTLTGHSSLLLEAVEYLPNEYRELKDMLEQRELAARRKPIFNWLANATRTPDVLILNRTTELELLEQGTWRERISERKRILTYAGKKDNSEMKLDYNPAWQSLDLEYARVIRADGTVSEISQDELNLMDAPWAATAPRYPAAKRLVASLPGVEVGSIIESSVLVEHRGKPFFSSVWSPNGFNPVEQNVLRVSNPAELELESRYNGAGSIDEELNFISDGRHVREWRFEALKGLKQEGDLPPWYAFNPTVFLSEGNWSEYARAVEQHLERSAKGQRKAISLARNLTDALTEDTDKIRSIRDYVAENISAAGPGLSQLPLSAITAADVTIASGYGNTSDRAVVLFAMLAAAELDPEFIFASADASRVSDLAQALIEPPQRGVFDEVLVRVEIDGEQIYLNDSNQYDALGVTEYEMRPGLTMKGEPLLIEARAGYADRSELEYAIELDADGGVVMEYERRYYGSAYGDFRKLYSEISPEERRRRFQEMVSSLSEAAVPLGDLTTDYEGYPGVESFRVAIDSYAVREGDLIYLMLPKQLGAVLPVESERRTQPLYIDKPSTAKARYTIDLPAQTVATVIAPKDMIWSGPDRVGSILFSTRTEESADGTARIVLEREADIEPSLIPVSDHAALVDAADRLTDPETWTIMIRLQ